MPKKTRGPNLKMLSEEEIKKEIPILLKKWELSKTKCKYSYFVNEKIKNLAPILKKKNWNMIDGIKASSLFYEIERLISDSESLDLSLIFRIR